MHTEIRLAVQRFSMMCALVLVAQIFALSSVPFEIHEPWDGMWHFLAYSALTLLLWIGTDGKRPVLAVAAVMVLGGMDELRQGLLPLRSADSMDFFADLCAAIVTASALAFFTRGKSKPCAESSPRSPRAT
jgi:VanZ family protein